MNSIPLSLEGEVSSGGYIPKWKRQGIHPPLFIHSEGDSCFSIYQIRWIKNRFFNFFFWNFHERTRHFSLRSQNSEYPRIFQVTGANQNAQKLLSTDLVNTNGGYLPRCFAAWQISNTSLNSSSLLKTGSLDNAIQDFLLAWPLWYMRQYTIIYKYGKWMHHLKSKITLQLKIEREWKNGTLSHYGIWTNIK